MVNRSEKIRGERNENRYTNKRFRWELCEKMESTNTTAFAFFIYQDVVLIQL